MSQTSAAVWRHFNLWPTDQAPAALVPTAGWAWPGISEHSAAHSNWKNSRMSTSVLVLFDQFSYMSQR